MTKAKFFEKITENERETYTALIEKLEALPDFQQKAAVWLIRNRNLAVYLCEKSKPLSPKEFQEKVSKAEQKKDYIYYALLFFRRTLQKNGSEYSVTDRKGHPEQKKKEMP